MAGCFGAQTATARLDSFSWTSSKPPNSMVSNMGAPKKSFDPASPLESSGLSEARTGWSHKRSRSKQARSAAGPGIKDRCGRFRLRFRPVTVQSDKPGERMGRTHTGRCCEGRRAAIGWRSRGKNGCNRQALAIWGELLCSPASDGADEDERDEDELMEASLEKA